MASFDAQPRFGETWAPNMATAGGSPVGFANLQNATKAVEVAVGEGEGQSRWLLHQTLFANSSESARALLQHSTKEKNENLIRLPEEDTNSFAEYVKFIYTGFILCFSLDKLVRMYVLGQHLQAPEFMEACYRNVKNSESQKYSAEVIKHTFDSTAADDKLRKLVTEQVGRGILAGKYSWKEDRERKLLASCMTELMSGVTDAIAAQQSPFATAVTNSSPVGGFAQPPSFNPLLFEQPAPANLFASQTKPSYAANTSNTSLFAQAGAGTTSAAAFGLGGFQVGGALTSQPLPPAEGTLNPPFAPTREKESNGVVNSFVSNTMMPAYSKYSSEELRLADYNSGRRYGSGTAGRTGFFTTCSSDPFAGLRGQQPTAFASQSSAQQASEGFGTQPAESAGGLFGARPAGSGGGLFGTRPTESGGGLFGSEPAIARDSSFGEQPLSSFPQSSGSIFRTSNFSPFQQPSHTGGLFGNPTKTDTAQVSGSLFGQRSHGLFGRPSTGLFGEPTTQAVPSSSVFGNPKPSPFQQPSQTGGLFASYQQHQPAYISPFACPSGEAAVGTGLFSCGYAPQPFSQPSCSGRISTQALNSGQSKDDPIVIPNRTDTSANTAVPVTDSTAGERAFMIPKTEPTGVPKETSSDGNLYSSNGASIPTIPVPAGRPTSGGAEASATTGAPDVSLLNVSNIRLDEEVDGFTQVQPPTPEEHEGEIL